MHPFKKLVQSETHQPISEDETRAYREFYDMELSGVDHAFYPVAAQGATQQQKVMAQVFTPANPSGVVLLSHGYYDHVGIYGHIVRYLLARGRVVVAFDQPGHGLSTGEPATIQSFDEYISALDAVVAFATGALSLEEPTDWVGQSMGGAVLMEYFAQYEKAPKGELVLFAPLLRPYAWWLNRWVFAGAKRTITGTKRVLTNNANNPEFLAFLARDPLQADVLPVVWVQAMVDWRQRFERYPASMIAAKIIQGQLDRTVDWRYNVRRLKKFYPSSEWLMLPEGRHHLVNESDELRATMFDWLDQCAFQEAAQT